MQLCTVEYKVYTILYNMYILYLYIYIYDVHWCTSYAYSISYCPNNVNIFLTYTIWLPTKVVTRPTTGHSVPFAKSQRPVAKVEGRIQIAIAIAQMQTLVIFHVTWEEGEFQGESAIRSQTSGTNKNTFCWIMIIPKALIPPNEFHWNLLVSDGFWLPASYPSKWWISHESTLGHKSKSTGDQVLKCL